VFSQTSRPNLPDEIEASVDWDIRNYRISQLIGSCCLREISQYSRDPSTPFLNMLLLRREYGGAYAREIFYRLVGPLKKDLEYAQHRKRTEDGRLSSVGRDACAPVKYLDISYRLSTNHPRC